MTKEMSEFNLSERIYTSTSMFELDKDGYSEEDVREFIKRLKKIVLANSTISYDKRKHFIKKIQELAGEKLR